MDRAPAPAAPKPQKNKNPAPPARAPGKTESRSKDKRKVEKKSSYEKPRTGTVALIGRANVGKSTLLNAMLGTKLAITSHQPQTTRDRIAGILTRDAVQFVFLDTPGLHAAKSRLGRRMNDVANDAASQADVVLFVVDVGTGKAPEIRKDDADALSAVPEGKPIVLVINKVDQLIDKPDLLPYIASHATMREFTAVVPLSARKRDGIDRLLDVIAGYLPEGEPMYPEDELSDKPVRFFVAEIVREQILRRTRQEVPHGVAVTIDAYEEPNARRGAKQVTRIKLTIIVAKESHKGILIGQGGSMLATIGTAARQRAEHLLGGQVHLDIRVKASPDWFDNDARLVDFGYEGASASKPVKKERGDRRTPRTPS